MPNWQKKKTEKNLYPRYRSNAWKLKNWIRWRDGLLRLLENPGNISETDMETLKRQLQDINAHIAEQNVIVITEADAKELGLQV